METRAGERSQLTVLVGGLVALGLVRVAGRLAGLAALLAAVVGCVAAFAVGILLLRLTLLP